MTETTPASANFENLKRKLRELFELDKADLDFGIYRILRQRHREITEFLDRHLETTVRTALESHGGVQQSQVAEDLRQAEAAAKAAGFNPDDSPKVKELRARLAAGTSLDAVADEVYSHLLTFFARYYQEGDFLGLHRSTVHGREKYMIPYNGEEVKLVWANMDQYYIKSSELLRDYTFRVRQTDLLGETEAVIHFKLVEGDTEKDNRQPDGRTTRAFALDANQPFAEISADTLNIRFRYREHAAERDLQKKLNTDTEKTLADNLPPRWKALLFADDATYQGKDHRDTRTVLQKHLRSYTARHQFDYFIHKDLGGFLRRELDFYLKNEVLHLDDLEAMNAPKADEYLSKLRAIRGCALPVIRMLAQLENFQKKLWLKKKFVVETRYCLTLDRVPESLYPEICANDAQWQEWEQLYAISEIEPDLFNPQSAIRNPQFLKASPHLMLDTRHFSPAFTAQLLASIESLDESLDGVCFHSENFQALQLMQEQYREQVKCVYIDPPYNTGPSEIIYKNSYKHSCWISLIFDRLNLGLELLIPDSSAACVAIDDNELGNLVSLIENFFPNYDLHKVIVNHYPGSGTGRSNVTRTHEYALFLTPRDADILRGESKPEGIRERTFRRSGTGDNNHRVGRPNSFYAVLVDLASRQIVGFETPPDLGANYPKENTVEGYKRIYPIGEDGSERVWSLSYESAEPARLKGLLRCTPSMTINRIIHDKESRVLLQSLWCERQVNAVTYGTNVLGSILGSSGLFSYPKSIYNTKKAVEAVTYDDENSIVVDFFGGSGTTGHAVINLNREDGGQRKYILVEMGEYFDTVLAPRLKKVVYATDWRDGKPNNRTTGISHGFKIVRLESYEDALNNLRLMRTPEQSAALQQHEAARDQYLLSYFLDVESAGSASLLDLAQFRDPFNYKLHIATTSAGETRETAIDLVETFNWLIGLKVKHVDANKGFVTVTGEKRAGGRTLIVWRTLGDDATADNAALEKYLSRIDVNPADTEFDFIYVNGSHTLSDPHNRIHLIEEEFQRRMFESESFESLS